MRDWSNFLVEKANKVFDRNSAYDTAAVKLKIILTEGALEPSADLEQFYGKSDAIKFIADPDKWRNEHTKPTDH